MCKVATTQLLAIWRACAHCFNAAQVVVAQVLAAILDGARYPQNFSVHGDVSSPNNLRRIM